MSTDDPQAAAETVASEDGGHHRISKWFLAVPVVLTIAAAAVAYVLLSPREGELMTTTDHNAEAVAVANAQPAEPAFTAPAPSPPASVTQ
jgi:hypothetical protein